MSSSSYIGYSSENKVLTSNIHAGVGAFSGFVVRALAQPLDVIKIRFQLQVEPTYGKSSGLYRGVLQSVVRIIKEEGVRALWKGHVPAQALTITYGVGQFGSYAALTKYLTEADISVTGTTKMICGGVAGMAGTFISVPCDVIRTRLVAQKQQMFKGCIDATVKTWTNEGVVGMWRGLLPTFIMTVPFTAIQFQCYSIIHQVLSQVQPKDTSIVSDYEWLSCTVVSGTVAGVVAKATVYPLDVLKKRRQIKGAESIREGLGKIVKYQGTLSCIASVTREETILAWYKGLWPSLVKSGVVSGLLFTVYECTCRALVMHYSCNDDDK